MIETVIDAIRINVVTEQHVVILREVDGPRIVPIYIGQPEAQAIARELQGTDLKRPQTHDLLRSVIHDMGGSVEQVVISDLQDGIFHATLVLDQGGRKLRIDSRASDAIALAVRVQSPILVDTDVMDQVGIIVTAEAAETPPENRAVSEESIDPQRLSVFRDFVNSLEVDDPKPDKE